MIVVDSSVWIAALRNQDTPGVRQLRVIVSEEHDSILMGDVILLEVLQGARTEADARVLEEELRRYPVSPMLDEALAIQAAGHYRALRSLGITIRKSMDLIIGTFCIAGGHVLLHDDRDFEPMVRHLGLRVA